MNRMPVNVRRDKVFASVELGYTAAEIAGYLDVSLATVRRDMAATRVTAQLRNARRTSKDSCRSFGGDDPFAGRMVTR